MRSGRADRSAATRIRTAGGFRGRTGRRASSQPPPRRPRGTVSMPSFAPRLDVVATDLQPDRVAGAGVLGNAEDHGDLAVHRLLTGLVEHLPHVAADVLEAE